MGMSKLGDFIAARLKGSVARPSSYAVTSTGIVTRSESVTPATALKDRLEKALKTEIEQKSFDSGKIEKLADSIQSFASSDEFTEAVNNSVSPPKPGETEDEFVARAKASIRKIFNSKYK